MKNVQLVACQIAHLEALARLAKATFREAFEAVNKPVHFEAYLQKAFSLPQMEAELQHPSSLFFLAQLDGQNVGYAKFNFGPAQTDIQDNQSLEVERIYLLQSFQGQKIGQLLMDKAIEIAQKNALQYIWLGVWEQNPGAIRFYQRQGFTIFDRHSFFMGDEEQFDWLMKLEV